MTELLYIFVRGITRLHESFLRINDSASLSLTDKQLHFAIVGLTGMALLFVIYPLFRLLSKNHVLVIAWIYVFTVMVVLTFAIEIGQGLGGSGTMDLRDVISGLSGFLFMFAVFAAVRGLWLLWARLFKGSSPSEP